MSCLLTTVFDSMKDVVEKTIKEGLRENIKIVIGGGVVTQKVKEYVGADDFCTDAVVGLNLCKQYCNILGG